MKAPDKIYVSIDTPVEKRRDPEFVGLAWTEEDNSCKHVEYISKDALVEWAKETYLNENASAIRKVCFKQLVEKLISM